jgi:5-formyltetrahydrofolate cyclo-ligase
MTSCDFSFTCVISFIITLYLILLNSVKMLSPIFFSPKHTLVFKNLNKNLTSFRSWHHRTVSIHPVGHTYHLSNLSSQLFEKKKKLVLPHPSSSDPKKGRTLAWHPHMADGTTQRDGNGRYFLDRRWSE